MQLLVRQGEKRILALAEKFKSCFSFEAAMNEVREWRKKDSYGVTNVLHSLKQKQILKNHYSY